MPGQLQVQYILQFSAQHLGLPSDILMDGQYIFIGQSICAPIFLANLRLQRQGL